MARVVMDIETSLSPAQVIAALTDFTERRPKLWKNLDARKYEVYEVGETTALIREGSPGVWAKERYDWSTPGKVTWTVQESNFSSTGDSVTAEPRPKPGGGSVVRIVWQRTGKTPVARLVVKLIASRGGKSFKGAMDKAFRHLEREMRAA